MGYVDRPLENPPPGGRGSDLEIRLARLSDAHPSGRRGPDGATDRPLTDDEHSKHVADVKAAIDAGHAAGRTTRAEHTIDRDQSVWTRPREVQHDDIVKALYAAADSVPSEGRAYVAGGLPGSGKTTVLGEHAGIDRGQFMAINPDEIKAELARRGMVDIQGLTPMEATEFAHEECSHIAKRLAEKAVAERRNVIWDITMSSGSTTAERVQALRAAGYTDIRGIFVDVPINVSLRRVDARHREAHDNYLAGVGLGGRFVPEHLVRAQADPEWGSANRRSFEQVKPQFDSWARYDNSRDGQKPLLVEASSTRPDDNER